MIKRLLLLGLWLIPSLALTQYDPLRSPNSFQADDNPLYWKNKKPHAAYWQQDVHYSIKASLNDSLDLISGTLELEYTNNSPDTLSELVFHLYQNAFDSGSYARQKRKEYSKSSDKPFQNIRMSDVTVDGIQTPIEFDNTIAFISLSSPMMPGEKRRIECRFTTQFGKRGGRMKVYKSWGYKHFNVVHWYPRISVYDQKFGWTTDQHLGHEFYGDFGAFDVELTLPEQYVLDGTGFLTNRSEVLPSELMARLDIKNFAEKKWNEAPSEIIPASEDTKTWKFHAENVHDFAWTADPTYRIGSHRVVLSNGHEVMCYSLAQEPHASRWQNAAEYAGKVIEVYSRDFGNYEYHKMIVADARDGMEYPMLTLDGGGDPGYRGLLAHEIGHNWFYGMVGNNETYRASLDEGFTQFLTSWALIELEGDTVGTMAKKSLDELFAEPRRMMDRQVYDGYYYASVINNDQTQLNVHSDHFHPGYMYGQVYYKTAVMLYNLQYVLGDELFNKAMKVYFKDWRFCHPYFEDFRNSVIHTTGTDLNWFFDQWLESEETIDYSIESVKRVGKGEHEIRLKRKGMQMPLDVQVITKDGEQVDLYIPNTYFEKSTDASVLPKWYGWGDFNDTYVVPFEAESGIKSVQIDPSGRLADVYQLDNRQAMKVELELNDFRWTRPNQAYEMEWNPIAWYNGYDGLKMGLELHSHYASVYHKLHAQAWFNTGLGQQSDEIEASERNAFNRFNYALEYEDPLRNLGKGIGYVWNTKFLDGLFANSIGLYKRFNDDKMKASIEVGGLYRPEASSLNYLMYDDLWNEDMWNNFTNASIESRYRYGKSDGHFTTSVRTPFLFSDYSYGYLNIESVNNNRIAFLNLRTRLFAQLGDGDSWAPESELYAAGGNPEEMMENPFTRSFGIIPTNLYGYGNTTGNFQYGGGLNLRGYNNYLLPEVNGDSLLDLAYAGQSGAAINLELEFDDAVKIFSSLRDFVELKTYLFADAGVINTNRPQETLNWSSVRMDAGAGACLEIKRWGKLTDLKPLSIRFDAPLIMNRPPANQEFFEFRWLIGFQRAF